MQAQSAGHGAAHLALLTAIGLLTSLGACASGPDLPRCGLGATASAKLEGYELGPGDQLRVTVFRHENLSGEFALDATGTVAMPLVGEIPAGGLTTRELEIAIEDQLQKEDYLVNPHVSIQVLTHRPFYVLGEVAQPGVYEHVSGMTLVNAVALAGGYTYRADPSSVTIPAATAWWTQRQPPGYCRVRSSACRSGSSKRKRGPRELALYVSASPFARSALTLARASSISARSRR